MLVARDFYSNGRPLVALATSFALVLLFLFRKAGSFYLNKSESLSHKDTLCKAFLKLALWFRLKSQRCEMYKDVGKVKDVKCIKTDRQTDTRQQGIIRNAHISFQLR